MTTTKKQLFTAVAMLVVAALALGTATYAWFVNNTRVSVDEMQFSAETARSLLISVKSDDSGWKGIITNEDLKADVATASLGAVMYPASIAWSIF